MSDSAFTPEFEQNLCIIYINLHLFSASPRLCAMPLCIAHSVPNVSYTGVTIIKE